MSNKFFKGLITVLVIGAVGLLFWKGGQQQNVASQSSSNKPRLKTGMTAPDFDLPAINSKLTVSLADYKGKQNVLMYFHEGVTCDPCWEQIPELEKYLSDLESMNTALISITVDSLDQIKKRAAPYNIKTPILSADATEIDQKYDLARYSMAMKVSGGMAMSQSEGGIRPGHTFILVDTSGRITWRKDYYNGFGMGNVPNGKMFVNGQEIINEVKSAMRQ